MDDYISREAALNFEMEIEADPDEIQAITKGMALYADYIKKVPAADVVERKAETNADRIRAMTDEELSRYIGHLIKQGRRQVMFDYECCLNWLKDECDKWFFEWLKQEVK